MLRKHDGKFSGFFQSLLSQIKDFWRHGSVAFLI